MSSLNKVMLIGNVGAAPEARVLQGGGAVTNLAIATGRTWRDKDSGEQKEKTEWHRVIVYAKQAEFVTNFVGKGSKVYIEGRIETRKWTDKSGVEKFSTEIIASEVKLLEKKSAEGSTPKQAVKPGSFDDMENDIPW